MTIAVEHDVPGLRERVTAWRAAGKRLALVPTMGSLHAGHLALIAAARRIADRTVVTIFVNPTQFAPHEDFAAYPRDLEADGAKVDAAGADLIFAPPTRVMYPDGFATTVSVGGPALAGLEDRFRPAHFAGVATVVAKLLGQAQPDVALFGEKDFQQLRVIQQMVRDLDIPVAIEGVPIVRETDGLALSSRNLFLSAEERVHAPALFRALATAAQAVRRGSRPSAALAAATDEVGAAGFEVDYIEARRSDTLAPVPGEAGAASGGLRILAAARIGTTRLIDNVAVY